MTVKKEDAGFIALAVLKGENKKRMKLLDMCRFLETKRGKKYVQLSKEDLERSPSRQGEKVFYQAFRNVSRNIEGREDFKRVDALAGKLYFHNSFFTTEPPQPKPLKHKSKK